MLNLKMPPLNKYVALCTAAILCAGAIGTSSAQNAAKLPLKYYTSSMASYVRADSDRASDQALGGTFSFGILATPVTEFELRATALRYDDDGSPGSDSETISAIGLGLNLFLVEGLGAYFHGDLMGGDHTLYNVGFGYDWPTPWEMSFRTEALYHVESSDFREPQFNVGVHIPLGPSTAKPAPPAPRLVEPTTPPPACMDGMDNDGDGLIDFPDDRGCLTADDIDEVDPPMCSDGRDNDGDGLTDFPNDKGCSSADDNDETDPTCDELSPGERANFESCALGASIVLRGVNFEFNSAKLTAEAVGTLATVVEALDNRPDIVVEVAGYTDSSGADNYNLRLSKKRAESVRDFLVEQGIKPNRLIPRGYGEAQPIADNATEAGRELNRRVELKVLSE